MQAWKTTLDYKQTTAHMKGYFGHVWIWRNKHLICCNDVMKACNWQEQFRDLWLCGWNSEQPVTLLLHSILRILHQILTRLGQVKVVWNISTDIGLIWVQQVSLYSTSILGHFWLVKASQIIEKKINSSQWKWLSRSNLQYLLCTLL